MSADVDWGKIDHFGPHEWPEGVLDHLNPQLIYTLDVFRSRLHRPVYPSPLSGAWARQSGSSTSRHYAVDRQSDAGDVFPDCSIGNAFLVACGINDIGGIGVYFDTQYKGERWPMMHIDLRESPEFWARINGSYYYPLRGGKHHKLFFEYLYEYSF